MTKTVRKTEAEAIGKAIGLETGSKSADYIHLYHGNASARYGWSSLPRTKPRRRHSAR
jgi:hypothetical protein